MALQVGEKANQVEINPTKSVVSVPTRNGESQKIMTTSRILLIDDDTGLLLALPEVVHRNILGATVDTVNSARQALAFDDLCQYDAIVSDIKMPGMDGLTLLAQLRARCATTPIILMTSHDDHDFVVQALRGGAFDFIQKPIDLDYFIAALQRAIQNQQLSRQVAAQNLALAHHAEELEEAVERAVAEAKAAQKRLSFLADASTLLISSLDYKDTLNRLAQLAVLSMADYCIVDMLQPDGSLHEVASAHIDRTKEPILKKIRAYHQENLNTLYPPLTVLNAGQSSLRSYINDSFLEVMSVNSEHLNLLRQLKPQSSIIVPIKAGEQLLGAITFGSTRPERHYDADDLALAEDLTRRAALAIENARLYNEAQRALQVRDQFLAIAAHEFKTPMTGIMGIAQLLLRDFGRDENIKPRHKERLRLLVEQTQRLNRLIVSLLDLSRLEDGQLKLDQKELDVAELIAHTVESWKLLFEKHTIEYVAAAQKPSIIFGDALRLEQVLQNLIQNAVKYSPDGGAITISVENEAAQVSIKVSDHGLGIPQEALTQIFNRFYRVETGENAQIGGLGLGLYVVREIINLHKGAVEVTSLEGEGSTFTIKLPLAQSVS